MACAAENSKGPWRCVRVVTAALVERNADMTRQQATTGLSSHLKLSPSRRRIVCISALNNLLLAHSYTRRKAFTPCVPPPSGNAEI
jgi:hypothetical protein